MKRQPRHRVSEFTHLLRAGFAAAFVLISLWAVQPAYAQVWAPQPNVADDTGNWSTTTYTKALVRLNGFRGYYRDSIVGVKRAHVQHIVRLPNANGKAYFAMTTSNTLPLSSVYSPTATDGYWSIAEVALNPYTDRLLDVEGADGQYVYEEHFTDSPSIAAAAYAGPRLSDGSLVISSAATGKGDWVHPAKMSAFGGILLIAAQNWDGAFAATAGAWRQGTSDDSLLFYDVRDPVHPQYLGKLTASALGLGSPGARVNVISAVGLARFENGYYHLSIGTGRPADRNYRCHESDDCFAAPISAQKWQRVMPDGVMAGQHGQVFHSREVYAEVPLGAAQGEPCYPGTASADADCAPGGTYRAIFFDAISDTVLPTRWWQTVNVKINAGTVAGAATGCGIGLVLGGPIGCALGAAVGVVGSIVIDDQVRQPLCDEKPKTGLCGDWAEIPREAELDVQGIPGFKTLTYQNIYGQTLAMDSDAGYEGQHQPDKKNKFFTQLYGHCTPNGGIYVNDAKVPAIYCVTESTEDRVDCVNTATGVTEQCNRIYENTPSASPSFGEIKLTNSGGMSVTYRGRGLTKIGALSLPPWGPCTAQSCPAGAVSWANTQIASVEVISGKWQLFEDVNYERGGYLRHSLTPGVYTLAQLGITRVGSFRALPEAGLSLFEHANYYGRMLNTLVSNTNLSYYCGDDYDICASLARDNCNFDVTIADDCKFPRTFDDKTSSLIVASGNWSAFNYGGFGPSGGVISNLTKSYPVPNVGAFVPRSNDTFSSVQSAGGLVCIPPTKPTSLFGATYPQGLDRPLLSWQAVNNATEYWVTVKDANDVVVAFKVGYNTLYMSATPWSPGVYKWRVLPVNRMSWCDVSGLVSDWASVTVPVPPPPPVQLTITQVNVDPVGFGSGTVGVSQAPVSEVGGSFYAPGTMLTLTAAAAAQSEFVRWTGDAASCGTALTCDLTITANLSLQAEFRLKPRLYLAKAGNGTVSSSPRGSDCSSGGYVCDAYATTTPPVTVTLTATPGAGAVFDRWAGDADCTDGSVTMNGVKSCTAVFDRTSYELEVTSSGGGSVAASDTTGAINCGPQGQSCTKTYATSGGTQSATLTATAAANFVFVRWYGSADCWSVSNGNGLSPQISVTVGAEDVSCSAMFVDQSTEYALTVEKRGVGSRNSMVTGTILPGSDLPAINCPLAACTQRVAVNATVRLTATPVRGARFDGWSGDAQCTAGASGRVTQVTMTSSRNCTALFSSKILLIDGSNMGTNGLVVQYESALRAVDQDDLDYDIWSIIPGVRDEPTAADLASYSRVVWFTGDAKNNSFDPLAGPSPAAEADLATYLDGGGCFMLTSSQYNNDRGGPTPFAQDYLGVSAVSGYDATNGSVTGAGLLPGFSSLGTYSLAQNLENLNLTLSDAIVANSAPGTDVMLSYGTAGAAAVGRDNGVYRTAYLGFPFMALPSGAAGRNTVMRSFMDFCLQVDRDDAFEVNDDGQPGVANSDFTYATGLQGAVSVPDLKILAGNDDFFRWESDANALTAFSIAFTHASGDLTLELYDNARTLIASSQSSTDNEQIVRYVRAGELYYLRVSGVDVAANGYELSIAPGFADLDGDGVSDLLDVFPNDPLEWADQDGDGVGDNADQDDDNDGIADSYELTYGALDAMLDLDFDGYTNLEEARAGTNPADPNSIPPAPLAPRSVARFGPVALPFLPLLLQ